MRDGGLRMDTQRAKNIGKMLYSKYDSSKRGYIEPKQCYQVFSDYCYRILNINNPPTMEEAPSMHSILDFNRDNKVTESDFQNLAVKYLCQQNNRMAGSYVETRQFKTTQSTTLNTTQKNYTTNAKKRLDVIRRLFTMFDKDESGFLTENEIPFILIETYKQMGHVNFQPSKQDVKSYMRMVDKNGDGKVSLEQFEELVLMSMKKAGFEIYQ